MGENNWKEMCWHGSPPCEDCWRRGETALDPISSAVHVLERLVLKQASPDRDLSDARNAALEEAAEMVEEGFTTSFPKPTNITAQVIAAAIRALKGGG